MKVYTLRRKQFLPVSLDHAWDFFSSPYNLEKITPEYMRFKIISEFKNKSIYEGMRIEYKVSPLLNIPLNWVTIISEVTKPYKFKDKQLKGPFALWEHTHTFYEVEGGLEMTDEVKYALPFGFLGTIAHALFMKKKIEGIFNYRESVLEKLIKIN
jgi:ligand-binding SRPBCC domain-containing protein